MSREEVHDAFSMVLQDTQLFEGTIQENLVFNQADISDEAVEAATERLGSITLFGPCRMAMILY